MLLCYRGITLSVEGEKVIGSPLGYNATAEVVNMLLGAWKEMVKDLPLDDFVVQLLKAFLNLGNIHVLPPCLLSFPRTLLVCRGCLS